MARKVELNIFDTHFGIWQDDANDPSLFSEIYGGILREMRRRGWTVRADPVVARNYRSISKNHRLASRGDLRASIEIAGRTVKLEFWATTWPIDNRNGPRYDFNKYRRMRHLDQLRVDLEFRRITAWLRERAEITKVKRDPRQEAPMAFIERNYRESWHSDKSLGRPVCTTPSYAKSADGGVIEHGATIWAKDRKGRIIRGVAYYHINNMWFVMAGGRVGNEACFHIWTAQPDDLRRKRNDRERRVRLEAALATAVRAMDYDRAKVLKNILFGDQPAFLIWARDHSAYYRSNYSGYTADVIAAGRYTRDEAETECRRSSDLEMVDPEGRHHRFDRVAA